MRKKKGIRATNNSIPAKNHRGVAGLKPGGRLELTAARRALVTATFERAAMHGSTRG